MPGRRPATRAAATLVQAILSSGAHRVAFVGLAKNVGKTTALVATLAGLDSLSVTAGTTSAGRDGEDVDALTGEEKPRFRLWPGQLVASAASTFASAPAQRLAELPWATRFGQIEIRRISQETDLEVIGPVTSSQMGQVCEGLEGFGARLVLLDGAFGRRAFASARVADAVVLSVGLAAGRDLDSLLARARAAMELIRLGPPRSEAVAKFARGALTDVALDADPPAPGQTLVAEDFASIFLSLQRRRALALSGVELAVLRPTRLVAVTANPTAPGGQTVRASDLVAALSAAVPGTPVVDLAADLVGNS